MMVRLKRIRLSGKANVSCICNKFQTSIDIDRHMLFSLRAPDNRILGLVLGLPPAEPDQALLNRCT